MKIENVGGVGVCYEIKQIGKKCPKNNNRRVRGSIKGYCVGGKMKIFVEWLC